MPSDEDRLGQYRSMRDFGRTPEPEHSIPGESRPRFVVQEHHATALHWDFRLEHGGVLVSWAVPRGLPADQSTNHLAVHTEDHPLSYLGFEGEIPEGNYGAGKVVLWDSGYYEAEKFHEDEVIVVLHGKRVTGRYALFQTKGKDWMIHRMDPPQDPGREPMPQAVAPMLAQASELPIHDERYGFEVKWDGVRVICYASGGRVRLQGRKMTDCTVQYPEIRALGEELGSQEAVFDGEVVALDSEGRPSFQQLQYRMNLARESDVRRRMRDIPVTYMIFDLLYLDGHSTMGLPYADRRRLLESLELAGPHWQTPGHHVGDGAAMLAASRASGLEGVVAKRLDSTYQPGKRSVAWLKIKNQLSQEFVIGGWTPGEGNREGTLGAILAGYYQQESDAEPQLLFAGRVGTGFSDSMLRSLLSKLESLEQHECPFANPGTIPRGARFVRPELVCEVEFTEWTRDGTLRHPSFKGLRDDKSANEVTREVTIQTEEDR